MVFWSPLAWGFCLSLAASFLAPGFPQVPPVFFAFAFNVQDKQALSLFSFISSLSTKIHVSYVQEYIYCIVQLHVYGIIVKYILFRGKKNLLIIGNHNAVSISLYKSLSKTIQSQAQAPISGFLYIITLYYTGITIILLQNLC